MCSHSIHALNRKWFALCIFLLCFECFMCWWHFFFFIILLFSSLESTQVMHIFVRWADDDDVFLSEIPLYCGEFGCINIPGRYLTSCRTNNILFRLKWLLGGKGGFLGCFPHINIPHTKHTNKWSFFVWVFHHPKNRKQTKKKTDEILSFMPFCHVHHSLTQTYNAQMRFRWTNLVSFGHSCEIISQNITCFPVANWLCFLSFDSIMVDALVQRKVEMVLQHTRRRKKRHQNICRHI